MIEAVLRKARRISADPVLRRWIVAAAFHRAKRPDRFTAHRPPYLDGLERYFASTETPNVDLVKFGSLPPDVMSPSISVLLPGETAHLSSSDAGALFARHYSDTETLLAAHRFAWLPVMADRLPAAWVDRLWTIWMDRFAMPDDSWAWHPYTAAERAINVLDFARRTGVPQPSARTLNVLAAHVPAIAARLEYFGDHNTSNHLANNGRGIYRIGLDLGLPAAIDLGLQILLSEARRIFMPSGMLREASSHYHVLLTRNYLDAWLAARRHGRAEAAQLREIAAGALAVLPYLVVDGDMPLIGDVSPDCPPSFLAGLYPGGDMTGGWCGLLDAADRAALSEFKDEIGPPKADQMRADGWHRLDQGKWTILGHVSPKGWVPIPSHGHQDMGSFDIRFDGIPLFVDPGRGAYDERNPDISALAHNTLTIDGADPYPDNKPYYDDGFRASICGAPPEVSRTGHSVEIAHDGYSRFAGLGRVIRRIELSDTAISFDDRVDGNRTHNVRRSLTTSWPSELKDDGVHVTTPKGRFRVTADTALHIVPATRWPAYGEPAPAHRIVADAAYALPARLRLTVETLEP